VLTPVWSGKFKRDVRRAEKRGKDVNKLKAILILLIEEKPLPPTVAITPSKGNGKDFATCTSSQIGCCSIASKTVSYA
jgi:mRNA interferase YafQ